MVCGAVCDVVRAMVYGVVCDVECGMVCDKISSLWCVYTVDGMWCVVYMIWCGV